jgi:hypothetical protein
MFGRGIQRLRRFRRTASRSGRSQSGGKKATSQILGTQRRDRRQRRRQDNPLRVAWAVWDRRRWRLRRCRWGRFAALAVRLRWFAASVLPRRASYLDLKDADCTPAFT